MKYEYFSLAPPLSVTVYECLYTYVYIHTHMYPHTQSKRQLLWTKRHGLHKTMIKMFYIPVRIFPTPVNSSDFYGQGKNRTHKYLYNNLKNEY